MNYIKNCKQYENKSYWCVFLTVSQIIKGNQNEQKFDAWWRCLQDPTGTKCQRNNLLKYYAPVTHLPTVDTWEWLSSLRIMYDGMGVKSFLTLKQLAALQTAEILAFNVTLHVVAKSLSCMKLTSTYLKDWKMLHETDAHTPDRLKNVAWNWCLHTWLIAKCYMKLMLTPDRLQNAAWNQCSHTW